MRDRKLASRYARAMFDVLPDPSSLETVDQFLTALADSVDRSQELRDFLLDPAVSRSSRRAVLSAIAAQHGMPHQVEKFLDLVVEHGRTGELRSIAEVFHEMREEKTGIVPARIVTATPMSEDLKQRARKALERMTARKVRLTCEVEPSLIAGAVTRIGSTVYDGSLRTQLSLLRRRMAEE